MRISPRQHVSANGRGTATLFHWLASFGLALVFLSLPSAFGAEREGLGRFLPFGGKANDSATTGDSANPYPTTDTPEQSSPPSSESGPMFSSPLAKVSWPEIKMPKIEFNAPWNRRAGEGEGWFATRMAGAKSATKEAYGKTRTAWSGAYNKMKSSMPGGTTPGGTTPAGTTPGDTTNSATQIASSENRPGFFENWFSGKAPNEEPEDVVEMMAKERAGARR